MYPFSGFLISDVVVAHLETHSPVSPGLEDRLQLVDNADTTTRVATTHAEYQTTPFPAGSDTDTAQSVSLVTVSCPSRDPVVTDPPACTCGGRDITASTIVVVLVTVSRQLLG